MGASNARRMAGEQTQHEQGARRTAWRSRVAMTGHIAYDGLLGER